MLNYDMVCAMTTAIGALPCSKGVSVGQETAERSRCSKSHTVLKHVYPPLRSLLESILVKGRQLFTCTFPCPLLVFSITQTE